MKEQWTCKTERENWAPTTLLAMLALSISACSTGGTAVALTGKKSNHTTKAR
jgi:hypothetical protein